MKERAVRVADVVTPNQFELDILSGRETKTLREACAAIDAIHALGPKAILVTSLHVEETPADAIELMASQGAEKFRLRTPKLPISVNGAGDAIAALFFAHWLRTGSVAQALSLAGSSIYGLLRRTADAGSREILLIEAQEEFVKPTQMFRPEPV
jgi:pyridoxine kinase